MDIVLGKPDGTWYTKTQLRMVIPEVKGGSEPEEPEPVSAEVKVIKPDDTSFAMFVVDTASYVVKNGKAVFTITTKNTSFDKIYFGSNSDDKTSSVQGTALTEGGFSFTFEKELAETGKTVDIVLGKPDGTWYTKTQLRMVIPEVKDDSGSQTPDEPEPTDLNNIDNGYYNADATTDHSMFKVVALELIKDDEGIRVIITLNKYGYTKMYPGTAAQAANDPEHAVDFVAVNRTLNGETRDFYTFTLPVDENCGGVMHVAAYSFDKEKWYDRTITIDLENLRKTAADGTYDVETTSSSTMFNIIDAKLQVVNGEMIAKITLSGTGYDYLYNGKGSDAANDEDGWIPFSVNEDGKYEYIVKVPALDTLIDIAAHSVTKDQWYDRQITFKSEGMTESDWNGVDPGNNGNTDPNNGNPDQESQHQSDSSGSTSSVDNSTTLPDGVYTPDKFSFSGGTGKVNITCTKITVSDGQAYATIVFDSGYYNYVKANGNIYYGDQTSTTSTFVIPVELNTNNRILANTTKMTNAHEVEYYIFPYLAAAEGTQTASGDAPVIEGIKYQSQEKLDYAEYFRIYNYEDGIILIEVDLTKDTAFEGLDLTGDKKDDETTGEEGETIVKTAEELTAELYKADTVKYLIVPEGVKIPAGLEKEMVVISLPKENLAVSAEDFYKIIRDLGCEKLVKGIGLKEGDIEDKALKDAVNAGEIVFTGKAPELSLRDIVSSEVDSYFAPGSLIPVKEEGKKVDEKDVKKTAEALYDMTDSLSMLGIPVIFDCSYKEKTDLAKYEWIKVYAAILGKSEEANKLFEEAVKASKTEVK